MHNQFSEFRQMFSDLNDEDWEGLCKQFEPAKVSVNFEPSEYVLKCIASLFANQTTKQVIDWLLELTVNAPYPETGQSTQDLAYAAAKHQARVAVGKVIMKAITSGQELIEQGK